MVLLLFIPSFSTSILQIQKSHPLNHAPQEEWHSDPLEGPHLRASHEELSSRLGVRTTDRHNPRVENQQIYHNRTQDSG